VRLPWPVVVRALRLQEAGEEGAVRREEFSDQVSFSAPPYLPPHSEFGAWHRVRKKIAFFCEFFSKNQDFFIKA
jgi:hypothetical protein